MKNYNIQIIIEECLKFLGTQGYRNFQIPFVFIRLVFTKPEQQIDQPYFYPEQQLEGVQNNSLL